MRADDRRANGITGEQVGRRQAAHAIREALLDLSISLEELLPVLEAARSLEAAVRTTLLSLGAPPSDLPIRIGDYVPQPVQPAREDRTPGVSPPPAAAAPPAPAVRENPAHTGGYLVNLDDENDKDSADSAPTPVGNELHSIAVVISGPRGPVDLARVHAALDSIDGVENLRLGRYDRSGVVVYVETTRNPSDLPIQQALSSVFAEGVTGRWATPDEYLATVGAA